MAEETTVDDIESGISSRKSDSFYDFSYAGEEQVSLEPRDEQSFVSEIAENPPIDQDKYTLLVVIDGIPTTINI